MINTPQKTRQNRIITLFQALKSKAKVFSSVFLSFTNKIIKLPNEISAPRLKKYVGFGLLISFISVIYVSGQIGSPEEFRVNTIHVFPEQITTTGWENIQTLNEQNVSQDSLYQDFNITNSAYIELAEPVNESGVTGGAGNDSTRESSVGETPTNDSAGGTDDGSATSTDAEENQEESQGELIEDPAETETETGVPEETDPNATENDIPTEAGQEEEVVEVSRDEDTVEEIIEANEDEEVPEIPEIEEPETQEPEPREAESSLEAMSRGFFKFVDLASGIFPFAQESILEPTEPIDEPEIEDPAPETEAQVPEEIETEPVPETIEEPVTKEETVSTTTEESTYTDPALDEVSASTTVDTSSTPEDEPSDTEENTEEDEESAQDESVDSSCTENCSEKIITLSGFGLPLLEETQNINGGQIRISFAAKEKSFARSEEQSLIVRYSLNNGESWDGGVNIMSSDESSNSINGGYYLVALPLNEETSLDALMVQMEYVGDSSELEGIFIESAWLELFTLEQLNPEELYQAVLQQDNGYTASIISGDELVDVGGEEISFTNTDENENETLIIKSDSETYTGLTEATTYFNVTNTGKSEESFELKIHFNDSQGQVSLLEEWNKNKPHDRVVPEYRPYVYHCSAGWEPVNQQNVESFEEVPVLPAEEVETGTSTETSEVAAPVETEEDSTEDLSSTTPKQPEETLEETEVSSEDSIPVSDLEPQITASTSIENTDSEEELLPQYLCRDTNVTRTCESLEGDDTSCRIENVKVREHTFTSYSGGWELRDVSPGDSEDKRNLLQKVKDFVGLGIDTKDVPEEFAVQSHSDDSYSIQPGETKYFKMEITFPPLSSGEFYIEAIGEDKLYGLLDPFWSSEWQYRLPVTFDNAAGSEDLTEHQVFFNIDNTLTDFWNNVNSDGSDVRFVREVPGNEDATWFDTSWTSRMPITIQSSQVPATISDYPVYVDLSTLGSGFFSTVQSTGGDIRITSGDGLTELPYDLVSINTGAETGELHFKATSVSSSTDTTFYIYFDNEGANGYGRTDTYGSENVWDSNYLGVYHLVETSSGAADEFKDSTSNNNDGVGENTLPSVTTGKLGDGQNMQSGHIDLGASSRWTDMGTNDEYNISAWINLDNSSGDYSVASQWAGGAGGVLVWADFGGAGDGFCHYGGTYVPADCADQNDQSVGSWQYIVARYDGIEKSLYLDAADTGSGPVTTGFTQQAVNFSIGSEQGDNNTRAFDGQMDEVRISSIDRGANWISAEYTNQNTPTTFYATSSIETLQSTEYTELDFWLQHFDSTGDEADVWIQLDSLSAGASTTIYMYYGNTDAVTGSDEFETFTYSTSTTTYYVVNDIASGPIEVYSYVDNNEVSIDGGTPISLDAGETTSFATYTGTSSISALGPIAATIDDAGTDSVAPVSFATTTFAIPGNRNVNRYFIAAPFASTSVQTYIGSSGVPTDNFSLATGTVGTANADPGGANGIVVEASDPVLLVHHENSTTNRDSFVAYPPTVEDIFGIDSNNTLVSALQSNSDPTVYCSGGSTAVAAGITRGESQAMDTCTQGNEGTGEAIRYTGAASAITSIQQADSDGNESTAFWPQKEFGTVYYMTTDSAYAAIVCSPRFGTSTIEVQTNGGTTVESATCVPSGEYPGKAYFVNGQDGDALAFVAGHKIVSTNGVPFYVIYEDDEEDNDETNILTSVQARKFTRTPIITTFGSQELTIDAEYEQLSFRWYENVDSGTPTTTWSLGEGAYASEGVPLTGQGAVNDEDLLRLRMNLQANVATGTATSTAFRLQYSASDTCSLSTNTWLDVGAIGSTTAAFTGYDNASVSDGSAVSSTTLASSTVFATYEEENLSSRNPSDIDPGEAAEWDWVLQSKNATVNTNYCFRMIRSPGQELVTYTSYPELYTAGPPLQATTLVYFDNERTADFDSVLEFTATDAAGDDIDYQVQIDDDVNFGSVAVNRNSATHFLEFENLNLPSNKAPFNSGNRIRFTSPTTLAASTTYWWRVRGTDPDGSGTYGEWSDPVSFTTDGSVTVSEWHQTTGEQFETDTLSNLATSTGEVSLTSSPAVLTTSAIDFDDATVGNAWGEISWSDTETSGSILYQVEYLNGGSWVLVPDSEIANNSVGNGTSPINILGLDTEIYNQIRIVATLTGATLSIQDITVVWGQRVETPTLLDPFDNEKTNDTTPLFTFTTTDPQSDDLEYEISYSTDYTFVSSTTINSSTTPADFGDVTTPADTNPFASGDTISYTVPGGSALTDNTTYWWRVRAKDPNGGDAWSPWSLPDAVTVDTLVSVSTWFQTTQEQFDQGTLSGLLASSSDSVEVSSQVGEYGKTIVTNGEWTEIATQVSYNDPVAVASVRYSPTGETQRTPRIRNKTSDTFEILVDNYDSSLTGTTTVDYMIMESGTWTLEDGSTGTQVIAGTYEDVTDVQANTYATSGYGADVTFIPAFSGAPAVIATVSSDNDSSWVYAHLNDGNTRNNPPTASAMGLYLGRGFESAVHDPEDIDYIAFQTGHGTNNGGEFDADFGADVHDEAPVTAEAFNTAFPSAPEVIIVMQGAEQGGNGGFAALYAATSTTASHYQPVIDEDGSGADRNHTPEPVLAVSFENASGILLRENIGVDLSGTIYSEPVYFSDGTGPKFEQLLWNDTESGTSTALYQVQYLTSTSSWAFIPDVDLTGNSVGTTTSPIDLTGLDVVTYNTLRVLATLQCASGNCPELHDWSVEWSEGVPVSGTAKEYDRITNVNSGTVRLAINGVLSGNTGTISGGTWTINNITAFDGDVITVFVDGALDADEAVNVFVYDGVGDMTGVELYEQHLTISSDENGTTTNSIIDAYDNSASGDEDIFFDVTAGNDLEVCASALSGCDSANLYVGSGNVFIPAATTTENISAHDFVNDGIVELGANTLRVSGSWSNNSTLSIDTSTVIFTATTSTETVTDADSVLDFYNVTFGETLGTTTWKTSNPLDIDGDLLVDYGTLDRASSTITVAGNLTTNANGFWSGIATTTFDGDSAKNWTDNNSVSQNIGLVVVDGGAKTVSVVGDVKAGSIRIEDNDTLSGGSANRITLLGDWVNNNIFTAGTSILDVATSAPSVTIDAGTSSFYDFTSNATGSLISFVQPTLLVTNDFTIATGTITLPSDTITIGGSFTNSGGTFMHNNGEVKMTSSGVDTITQNGTPFLNAFYDLRFTGSGDWSFTETHATTSESFLIENGTVTMPSGTLTVGGDLTVSGSGDFAHNNGEVELLIQAGDSVVANGSDFNDVRIKSNGAGGWYDSDWDFRKIITVESDNIDANLTDFPVYVDLSDLGAGFFSGVKADGGDIRVTKADGVTELAREIVSINTGSNIGELHFNADSVSSTTDTSFYIYYGNSDASDYAITDTYGAENTWNSAYEAVYHLSESGSTYIDSTDNSVDGAGEGTDPTATGGQIGDGQSITAGRIDIGTGVTSGINTSGEYTISAWINQNTSTGDQAIIAQYAGGGDLLLWADTGGLNPSFCNYMNTYMPTDCQDVDAQNPGTWQYITAIYDGTNGPVYVDGSLMSAASAAGTFGIDLALRWSIGSANGDSGARQFNGLMDEVRISSVDRSASWIKAEYTNQSTTTDFYTVSAAENAFKRTFSEANVTVLGDVIIESGEAVFPSNTLLVGGSFDNDGIFDSNNGTVEFDSVSGSENIAAGTSTFATLLFDSTLGNWTMTEHATATNDVSIVNASNFTLNSGLTLDSSGTFTNSVGGASTTWTGSVLRLSSGNDFAINSKTDSGDQYGTLLTVGDGDISMWNSSSSVYTTQDTSSIYSQDHSGVDGDLYIYGDYIRSSGTEHWSYATDFDGTDLSGGSERQAEIRVVSGGSVIASSSILSMVGTTTASTTVDSQSGTFALSSANATVTAQYAEITGTDIDGFQLTSSSTISLFDNLLFSIGAGVSSITVDASTVDTNPASQFFNTDFATAGGNVNVTLNGSPNSYWWFRDGIRDRYGEAFDNADGDPGAIRWDDSSYTIDITGTAYSDDGMSTLGGPTCDGVTNNVRVVVDGGTYTDAVPCNGVTGIYSFSNVAYVGDPDIIVYLDTNGGINGSVLTKTPTANITDLDIYADRVITRHEDVSALDITDIVHYDNSDDTDIGFKAATGTPDTLTVLTGNELHIASSTTFDPDGVVTINGDALGSSADGSLHIDDNATFVGYSTSTITLGGSFTVDTGATFTSGSTTVLMNATTTGKTITTPVAQEIVFNELTFNGLAGGWNINGDIRVIENMNVSTGTVTGTSDVVVENGSMSGDGTVSFGSGTVTIEQTNTLGGITPWSFGNLVLGSGVISGTTTPGGATTTVLDTLTISTGHYLDAGNTVWDLAGIGTVFVEDGTFIYDTSTIKYSGTGATNILSTDYYNLIFDAQGSSPTYTVTGLGVQAFGDLSVGGTGTTTVNFDTNDAALNIEGDMTISSLGTFVASDSGSFTLAGSYSNDGTFTGSGGTLTFDGSGVHTIEAGNSPFSVVDMNGTGDFTVTEHATATTFTLTAADDFTLQSSQTLAVGDTFTNSLGGADTVWTGSTLYLYGGNNYEISDSTISDTYATLIVGANTDIRMWNSDTSTTTVHVTGSLYSQDHANVDGDVYIYGNYQGNGGTDYWNYARDFDGTDLTGGGERQVDVYLSTSSDVEIISGGLQVLGGSAASTTIQKQGAGTYGFRIGGTASTSWSYYEIRDTDSSGLVFSGTPSVNTISNGDFLVEQDSGSAITVGGTVIDQNPAKTFTKNTFATTSSISAFNVTATGTSVSSWRFTNHMGNIAGEAFDSDPDGDPGYIVWDDSAALITISGTIYSDEGTSTSTICDGATNNIHLRVEGLTSYTTSCSATTGVYSISDVGFSSGNSLIVYIDGETEKAATVTEDPSSNINNMDLYENRVIVRQEGVDSLSISDMAVWDSSDDADIPFTAVDAGTDTLSLPSDRKLIVWDSKEFEPGGDVTITGGGVGAAYDGTLELYDDATFTSNAGESHIVGGSLISGTGSTFDSSTATFTFTTPELARTVDTNDSVFHDLVFNGSGSWTVTDTELGVNNDFTISQGAVTLPSATTTVGGSLSVTGGSFDENGGLMIFTSSAAENIKTNGSDLGGLTINGSGSFVVLGDNATATQDVLIKQGTFTSATGTLSIGGDFINSSTFTHGSGILRFVSSSATDVTTNGSDLYSTVFAGTGPYVFTDGSVALLGDIMIESGDVTFATTTMSIGGSIVNSGGSFNNASGTVLFNSGDSGETINPGSSAFNNLSFSGASGGWTITNSATTTGNFTLSSASNFTQTSGTSLYVGGVFTNLVGGAATTWTGSTIIINSGTGYSINTKAAGSDTYNNMQVGSSTALRMWDSSGSTITMEDTASSLYSQDHAGVSGSLYIYGNYSRNTGADYWSYATDFDGASLSGSERQAYVYFAENSTTTLVDGSLNIVGADGFDTTISNQGTGTYALRVLGGTLNAQYYSLANMNVDGLVLSGMPNITSLTEGNYTLSVDTGSLITLSSTTLNHNTGLLVQNASFATTTAITGNNISLVGTTTGAWTLTGHTGNISGEAFDSDGGTDCGSLRWDDSSCLLTQQSGYRMRNDDGGEGVPNSEWFNASWSKRQRVKLTNDDLVSYTNAAIKLDVTHDGDMEANFDDLRFTSSDGTTQIDHFTETYTASTDADVWVKVPLLATSTDTEIYMYYGNVGAADGSATSTFSSIDDFEDNNISEYSGDTAEFTVDSSGAYERTYRLEASDPDNGQTDLGGMYNNGVTVSQGEKIRFLKYIDTSTGSGDEVCTLFGTQSQTENYAVCLELYGTDRMSLVEDALYNDSSGTVLASTTVTYSTGWYEVEIDWDTDDSIFVTLSQNDSVVATTSATDSTYTSGGIGYALWFYHGAWDSYSSRPLLENEPTVSFGAEQVSGGASWIADLNTLGTGVDVGENVRIRFLVENTGLIVTDQNYEIEFAAKGASPSCEAVSYASYVEVPNQALCGTSDICMQSSTYITDLASTTDLLGGSGTFTQGQVVEDTSNNTGNLNIDNNEFTELEYVVTPTVNVTDSNYCFRVTNEGTDLDSYTKIAELGLMFTPNITSLSLNGGQDIILTGGSTTTITATGTVSDLNGYTDLAFATSTMFRSGVTASCSADTNNCYISGDPLCAFSNCSGDSCDVTCTADIYYHADPTDIGVYAGETWREQLEVSDLGGAIATATAPSIDLLTLRAISVDDSISYGSLEVNANTGLYNATTTVENIGNDALDVSIEGTDLSDGGSSAIPASEQVFATSTFEYGSCVFCSSLSTTSSNYELDLDKPTSTTPAITDDVYWGIAIPFGAAGTAHQGNNTFYAISD